MLFHEAPRVIRASANRLLSVSDDDLDREAIIELGRAFIALDEYCVNTYPPRERYYTSLPRQRVLAAINHVYVEPMAAAVAASIRYLDEGIVERGELPKPWKKPEKP